mgnify:CR=1 FL=1
MRTRIYLIGNVPPAITDVCIVKFYKVQMNLVQMGYDVINPIERLTNDKISFEDAKRKNLNDLMMSDAVYIMPCIEIVKGLKNVEIKLAFHFNLTIISGSFVLPDENVVDVYEESFQSQSSL